MTRRWTTIALTAVMGMILVAVAAGWMFSPPSDASAPSTSPDTIRFGVAHVWVNAGEHHLAAWQLECKAITGVVKIVGVEGGEHPQFRTPPYYDPAAMQQERVILAALSTAQAHALPTGRTRVATIHFQHSGDSIPEFAVSNVIAADDRGQRFDVQITITMEPQS